MYKKFDDGTRRRFSNFLDFLAYNDRIIASNFLGSVFPIVKRAVVFITVSMDRTKQTGASAFKTCIRKESISTLFKI